MRAQRAAQPEPSRRAASERICQHIAGSEVFARARRIALYYPFAGEVDLRPLFESAWRAGKAVALPRLLDGATMEFRYHVPDSALGNNRFGIPEPSPDAEIARTEAIDLAVFPGVAFDAAGHRLGMGRGYYDRAFASAHGAFRLGVGFALQLVAAVPADDHDLSMHAVVTELGLRPCGASAEG